MIGGQGIRMVFFHNLTSKDLTLDFYRVQKTQAHRAIGCEYGGGEKGRKKKSQPKKVPKNLWRHSSESGETVGIVTIYITPFPFGLFVFHLEHLSSLIPNRCSCFLGSFIRISTSNMRWSCIAEVYCLAFFWGLLVLFNMCNRTTYDVHDSIIYVLLFSPRLVVQDSKRQPCQLNRNEIGR